VIDDQFVLSIERLRDELGEFKSALRSRYKDSDRQITAEDLKERAAHAAEKWMVAFAPPIERLGIISSDYLANLGVHFQRLLTFSERATRRKLYDGEIKAILSRITSDLVIPLKRYLRDGLTGVASRAMGLASAPLSNVNAGPIDDEFRPTAFVAHSFSSEDKIVVDCISRTLQALGITIVTGEKPRADRISEKVKRFIEEQYFFVAVFTRRERLTGRLEWTTSAWLIDEKAYAVGKRKKLILLKEDGVQSIGGIQGDYEFIEFSRKKLHEVPLALLSILDVTISGVRS
jgi:hypothetical protein